MKYILKFKALIKKAWSKILSKTTIDEKIESTITETVVEIKSRIEETKAEIADVKEAIKEVRKQSSHVVKAAQGEKRKGRKPNKNERKKLD
jgi:prefoldin subunit 5